jgi:hypothetical protein
MAESLEGGFGSSRAVTSMEEEENSVKKCMFIQVPPSVPVFFSPKIKFLNPLTCHRENWFDRNTTRNLNYLSPRRQQKLQ